MSAPSIAEVDFPVVVLGEALLTGVRVERMKTLDHQERFAVGQQRLGVLDILTDARADEPGEQRLDGVLVRFLRRDFTGTSFGLALALADKRARYVASGGRVIATGCLPCGSRGAIAPVEGFDAKVRRLLADLGDGEEPAVFACAADNLRDASDATRDALAEAERAGRLVVRPVAQLNELADLWGAEDAGTQPGGHGSETEDPPAPRRTKRLWMASALLVLVATVAIGGTVAWRMADAAPMRRCEAALNALEAPGAQDDRARVAAAVIQCGEASRQRPQSGRLLFLTGQAHALNGGKRLAAAYWQRAALAGDRDGLAAHGRELWLSGPSDAASIKAALGFLAAAGEKGSAAAIEDMAEIYRDGIGVAPDLGRAEQLLRRAQAMRKDGK